MYNTNLKKNSAKNIFFIGVLLITAFMASVFMVAESAEFYARFYPSGSNYSFGLFAAILNEVFLVIMAAVWLPKVSFVGLKFWHPGNFLIKLLMLALFANTVFGATFNVVQNKFSEIQDQQNRIDVLKVREEQLLATKKKLDLFIAQNQKVNTIIATRELASVQEELAKLKSSAQSTFTLWSDIVMLFFLRFTIQLSNITCVWIASWLYRNRHNALSIVHSLKNDLQSLKIEAPKAIEQIEKLEIQPEVVTNNEQIKNEIVEAVPIVKPDNNSSKQVSIVAASQIESEGEVFSDDNDYIAEKILNKINGYLSNLPAGFSDYDLCKIIGYSHLTYKRLINKSTSWSKKDLIELKKLNDKIEYKYNQENNLI